MTVGAGGRADPSAGPLRRTGAACASAARWALYASVLAPLVYATGFVYPFLVPAALWFRLTVALAAVLASAAVLAGALRMRPSRDAVAGALVLFVAASAVSALAGPAPEHSFFGGFQRMGGVVAWGHYAAWYLLLRTLLDREGWRRLLGTLAACAAAAAALGALQAWGGAAGAHPLLGMERVQATMGNPGYLSVFLLFGLVACGLLARRTDSRTVRAMLAAAAGLQAAVLLLSTIRTTLIALVAAVLAGGVVLGLGRGASRRARKWGGALAGIALLAAAGLWAARGTAALRSLPTLEELTGTSVEGKSLQTRFAAWEAALDGFAGAPLLGVGPENYRLAFDRHFPPRLYEVRAGTPPYFTEAHDEYLEAAAETGLVGTLALLLLWAALARRGWRAARGGLDPPDAALVAGCFTAWAVFLLAWFRTPTTFPAFLALAAFAGAALEGEEPWGRPTVPGREGAGGTPGTAGRAGAAAALVLFAAAGLHTLALARPARGLARAAQARSVAERVERHEAAVDARVPGAEEAATEYAGFLAGLELDAVAGATGADRRALARGFRGAARALEEQIDRDPANARHRALAADLALSRFRLDGDSAHLERAVRAARAAVERSPPRLRYRRMLSDLLMTSGRPEEAMAALEGARGLLGGVGELHYAAAKIDAAEGRIGPAARGLERADSLGYEPERSNRPVYATVATSLLEAGDTARARRIVRMAGGRFSFEDRRGDGGG